MKTQLSGMPAHVVRGVLRHDGIGAETVARLLAVSVATVIEVRRTLGRPALQMTAEKDDVATLMESNRGIS